MFKPRPKQAEILAYAGGRMGVLAVPGSGKTRTLSALAARLVAEAPLVDGQEVLIVTLSNAAVNHFARQVDEFIREMGLLPGQGYRVRTLHGLANDIVRERPTLAGLSDQFRILDERESDELLQDVVYDWVRTHAGSHEAYVQEKYWRTAPEQMWPDLLMDAARGFIKQAKDWRYSPPTEAQIMAGESPIFAPLGEICDAIYDLYERALRYRGAVDFQDLIRLAEKVLRLDADYLARRRFEWPVVLEDEAQDSSELQETILRLLVGENGNWVRVGDPNQAIYETFTTANPDHLRRFVREDGVARRELPNSGRSTLSIMRLANQLITWTQTHPNPDLQARLPLSEPFIEATPEDDPQGNPPDEPQAIQFWAETLNPDEERDKVVQSLKLWLPSHQDWTVAVLLPINTAGSKMVDALRLAGIPYVENLRTTTSTRKVVGAVTHILAYLNQSSGVTLSNVYRVWLRDQRSEPEALKVIDDVARRLRGIKQVEEFTAPRGVKDWLDRNVSPDEAAGVYDHLRDFREVLARWSAAAMLPIDQLVLMLSGDLFSDENEIATAYSLALYLRRFAEVHAGARLPQFAAELEAIARNQRKFNGVGDEDEFDPTKHRGKVAVTTMHKAKGLEWDRLYLMSLSGYDFPSAEQFDQYIGEKWFVRDQLNVAAEAMAQLKAGLNATPYTEGDATRAARLDYAGERLRLLYVGLTRARRELVLSWNSGRDGKQREAMPVAALREWWERYGR